MSDRLTGRERTALVAGCAVLVVVLTWPQAINPSSVPSSRDSWFNMWRLAWIAHQLRADPVKLFDANIYYPERGTLALSDAMLMQGLLAAPLLWLGVPTPIVHTLLVLGSFMFAGLAACALVRYLTGSLSAGIAAGIVFAFTPYRFDHYMHLELLWGGWMPLALLAIHRAWDRPTDGAGAIAGLLVAAQVLSCIYYGVFFATILAVFIPILAVGQPWRSVRPRLRPLLVGAAVTITLLLPYAQPYRQAHQKVGERGDGEVQQYSAGPTHYLAATPENALYGRWADELGRPEKRLFPGLIAAVLVVIGAWPPFDRRRVAYLVALLLAVDLSIGLNGLTFGWLRDFVLPYRGLRVPARAAEVALLMAAVLAGYGWARLERSARALSSWSRRVAACAAMAVVTLEYVAVPLTLVPATTTPGPVYRWLATQPRGAVAEFPMPDEQALPLHDAEFAYYSTFHWQPLVNGYSGNVPLAYFDLLRAVRSFPSDSAIDRLRQAGVRYVILHERLYGPALYGAITQALDRRTDITRRGRFGPPGSEAAVYELTRAPD